MMLEFAELDNAKFEAMLFALCKNEDNNTASMRIFLQEIRRTGIKPATDKRLKKVIENMSKYRSKQNISLETLNLDLDQFKFVLSGNLPLLIKIFRNDLVIPEFASFCESVTTLYQKLKNNFTGEPAGYIPQLARMPKEKWGISICTVDGQRFSIGDVHDKFTVQSTSKPITYSLTLEELGTDEVHKYQGREPSGRMFNEIVLDHNNQPHNPMVNSGAIMSSSILLHLVKKEMNMAQKYDYVFSFFKKMAGGEYLGFNNSIFLSERDTADRNFALAYFLRENNCFPPPSPDINIPDILDFYFQTCSLEMTAESESVIASTLANGGTCPITGENVMKPDSVKNVLSLMLSCGLYNYSGDFAFKVGLPGKSGVSGVLVLVVPNVMGMCFWSPPLDEFGNSVRGVQFCEEFVKLYTFQKVTGELLGGTSSQIDPTRNKYEVASQLIIHLLMAASAGDETALKCAYQQGVDMNLGDYDGRTALHLAAAEGHVRSVKFLLDVCKVRHDVKDRWGQTPLSESILFKHTKVASILKRHERAKALQTGQALENHGEALWRKLVERKMMTGEEEKKKPLFKFNPNFKKKNGLSNGKLDSPLETMEALKKNLEDRTRTESTNELGTLEEDGEEEIHKAAKFIQNRFRTYLKKKSQSDLLADNLIEGSLDLPGIPLELSKNGTNGHADDSGVSSLKSEAT